jgi:hypothetical protein
MMRLLAIAMVLLLTGCGFQPLHGDSSDYDIEIGTYLTSTKLKVANSSGMAGQQLLNAIEDRFNPDSAPSLYNDAFLLEFDLTERREAGVIEQDGSISRFNIRLLSKYRLIDLDTREVLDKGTITRTASYFNAPEKFSAYIAEKDAVQRALIEMSADYKLRLSAYFAREYKLGQRAR